MSLRPDITIQRILISTTSRLVGDYHSDTISLDHAWHQFGQHQTNMPYENLFLLLENNQLQLNNRMI